jgi:hypothetical protein
MVFRFLNRSPFNSAGAAPSPRPAMRGASPRASDPSARELALEAELAALRREQAVLVREEAKERANLTALEDKLDTLANEIDSVARRTRNPALRENGVAMVARVKAAAQTNGAGRNTQIIVDTIKYALGIGPSPWTGAAPPAASAQPAAVRATAQEIIDSGNRAAGRNTSTDVRTGEPKPLPSPLTRIDPAAAGIVRAGRRARNEPDE